MPRRGRPMKVGKRKNGRPIPTISFDKGTERAQAMRELYGTDCTDALGRAYRAGLLGDGDNAKCLLDTGRRIAAAYWHAYSTGSYKCALGDSNSGTIVQIDHERAKRREEWLNHCLREVEQTGNRRQFDQLVIDVNPDCGPQWLDRMISYKRMGISGQVSDIATLNRALEALALLVV